MCFVFVFSDFPKASNIFCDLSKYSIHVHTKARFGVIYNEMSIAALDIFPYIYLKVAGYIVLSPT